ncbi:hypothetical protein K438DRAFT_1989104 [Mycena galopus ATCC 62051]|nr:hypothetical protein K438DRAFT_1989104 [Mycena galopus ATCC 62051]
MASREHHPAPAASIHPGPRLVHPALHPPIVPSHSRIRMHTQNVAIRAQHRPLQLIPPHSTPPHAFPTLRLLRTPRSLSQRNAPTAYASMARDAQISAEKPRAAEKG